MKQYSIKFIGRNAYISDADGRSMPILSIDFKSVQTGKPNGTTLDIDPSQPIIVITQTLNQIIVHALWFPASARIPALLFP